MTLKIACFCPENDRVERTLGVWATTFINAISGDARYKVICDQRGPAFKKSQFSSHVGTADIVLFFGHGTQVQLGDPEAIGISDASKLTNRILVGIACHAGYDFGRNLVENHGVDGFLGFDDQLVVVHGSSSVFAGIVAAALRELIDPATPNAKALNVLKDGFRNCRYQNQAVHRSPSATRRQRHDAYLLWSAAFPNEKTAVWIETSTSP